MLVIVGDRSPPLGIKQGGARWNTEIDEERFVGFLRDITFELILTGLLVWPGLKVISCLKFANYLGSLSPVLGLCDTPVFSQCAELCKPFLDPATGYVNHLAIGGNQLDI